MASPLVETKLYVPMAQGALVARPRLHEGLARGSAARLTLVSAPAGFGKTTVLSAWLTGPGGAGRALAWVSLDDGDRRPASFWTYVVSAVQRVVPGVGAGALAALQSAMPPLERVLAPLLNELSAAPGQLDLVLDDYHLADGPEIAAGMAFLLEHLPPRVHLWLGTRADPVLPLARLRAHGELVELRAADLRFTPDEVAAYLNQAAGLGLAPGQIAALEARTEGWIAALQLAMLSLQGRDDQAGFIAGFAGDDRHVLDYLVEEVLQRQPEPVRRFLERTSILDRLGGPLCDAVTGGQDGKAMLATLERANLFVVPLDDRRRWFRYHQLFADALQAHQLDERPDEVAELHLRASRWYERQAEPVPAVRHALAAGDPERAAGLVELAIPALRRGRQEATIRAWLDDLDDELVRRRPVLAVGLAGALMALGEFDGVEARLQDAERALAGHEPGVVVLDQAELPRLPGAIQLFRTALALARGDAAATIGHARLAVERAAADDHVVRAGAAGLAGLASWGQGDLDGARRAYADAIDGLRRAGHIPDVLGCSITLADIQATQGRLGEARRTYERALRLAGQAGGQAGTVRGVADMHVGLSQVAYERGDLAAATRHLLRSQELGERAGLPQHPYRWRVALARVREAEGDLDGALALLDEAERVYEGDFSPNVRPVPALRARLLARHGQVLAATAWAREHGLDPDDELSYLREYEHITLARVLVARAAAVLAGRLLERLLAAAEAGGRGGSVLDILVTQALARQATGGTPAALPPLERAIAMAEAQGHVRVFADEGAALGPLLATLARRRPGWDHLRRLLDAAGGAPAPAAGLAGLAAPLSQRELAVLRLLGTDLDGPAIARELVVSLNTLRTHTRNIYAKLGVNSRRAAVRQAAERNLLGRGER